MLTSAQVAEIRERAHDHNFDHLPGDMWDIDTLLRDRDELVRRLAASELQVRRLCAALVNEAGTIMAARVLNVVNAFGPAAPAPAAPMEDVP